MAERGSSVHYPYCRDMDCVGCFIPLPDGLLAEFSAALADWRPVEKEPAPGVIHTASTCENEHEQPLDE